jgi:hypothetical protein
MRRRALPTQRPLQLSKELAERAAEALPGQLERDDDAGDAADQLIPVGGL